MEELSSYLEQINKLLFENLFEDAKALLLFVETDVSECVYYLLFKIEKLLKQ